MKRVCNKCKAQLGPKETVCPHCGAENPFDVKTNADIPCTVEALKEFARQQPIPPEKLRIFIGEDVSESKAFGLVQNGERFTVYKNKATGAREVLYQGDDETAATKELYERLQKELALRRSAQVGVTLREYEKNTRHTEKRKRTFASVGTLAAAALGLVIVVTVVVGLFVPKQPKGGYYRYRDGYYYCQNGSWYVYDSKEGWVGAVPDEDLKNNSSRYFEDNTYHEKYRVEDFRDSDFYVPDAGDHEGGGRVGNLPTNAPDIDDDWQY